MNTIFRKSVLGVAGLAFAGGVFAGPLTAHAAPAVDAKPAAVAVQADKPVDSGKLMLRWGPGPDERRWSLLGDDSDYWDGEADG